MRKFLLMLLVLTSFPAMSSIGASAIIQRAPQSDLGSICSDQAEGAIDLVMLIDQSASLEGQNIKSLKTALTSLSPLLDKEQKGLRIGVVTFSSSASVIRNLDAGPFTPKTYKDFVADVTRGGTSLKGGTNYIDATTVVADQFRKFSEPTNCRVLLWFTDGRIDLFNNDGFVDGRSILEDFCGAPSSGANKSSIFRDLKIRPYVVLLTKKAFSTELPIDKGSKDDYSDWASVVALRGLTGDWKDEEGIDVYIPQKPVLGEAQCTEKDQWGDLIQVTELSELQFAIISQLIKGITDTGPNDVFCPKKNSISSLPAGIFFDQIVLATLNPRGDSADFLSEPNSKDFTDRLKNNVLILNGSIPEDRRILDSLPNGWSIEPASKDSSAKFCFGYKFRSSEQLVFEAAPSTSAVRIFGNSNSGVSEAKSLSAKIDLGKFSDYIGKLTIDDNFKNELSLVDKDELQITPGGKSGFIEDFPSSIVIRPSGLEDGKDGDQLLKATPLRGTIHLTNKVSVKGVEDLPRIECSSDRPDIASHRLSLEAKNSEVQKGVLKSKESCQIVNMSTKVGGFVTVRFMDPLEDIDGVSIEILDSNSLASAGALKIVNSDTNNGSSSFSIGTDGQLPNQVIDYLGSSTLELEWSNGEETFVIGEVQTEISLSLLPRSDPVWSIILAILSSLIAAILAYAFLFLVLRKTASVGRWEDLFSYSSEEILTITGVSGSENILWSGKASFGESLDLKKVEKVNGVRGDQSAMSTRFLILRATTGSFFKPKEVIRGPWTDVSSSDSSVIAISCSSSDKRRPGAARAPLGPAVFVELLSVDSKANQCRARITFIFPSKGDLGGLNGVSNLAKRDVERTAVAALRLASTKSDEKKGSVTAATKEIAPDSPPPLKGGEVERPDGGPLKPLRPSASEIIPDQPTRSGRAINVDPNKDRPPGSNKN